MKNLILSGGIFHPFVETTASVAGHLAGLGITSVVRDVPAGFEALSGERFDLLTINALSWSMVQADKYAPYRAAHAFVPTETQKQALLRHIDAGGGLLGLHTAAICFDRWRSWRDILGVGWEWGQSHHPPPGNVRVTAENDEFTLRDELYCSLYLAADTRVLATGRADGVADPQPVLTVRERSAYLALGHDLKATSSPGYRRLLRQAATCALGQTEGTG